MNLELHTWANYRALAQLLLRHCTHAEALERSRVLTEDEVRDPSTGRLAVIRLQNHIDAIHYRRDGGQ